MQNRFILNIDDIEKARTFSLNLMQGSAQSTTDFGETSLRRNQNDFLADTIQGKLSEIVFKQFLEKHCDFSIGLDFGIYFDKLLIDYGQDIERVIHNEMDRLCRSRIDIKATRMYSKWLLVESHKFWSDAYVLVKLDLPRDFEADMSYLYNGAVVGEVCGFAYYFDLIDPISKEPWFGFRQNTKLFDPAILGQIPRGIIQSPSQFREFINKQMKERIKFLGGPLKAKQNFGLPIAWLRNNEDDWGLFFRWVKGSSIPMERQIVKSFFEKPLTK